MHSFKSPSRSLPLSLPLIGLFTKISPNPSCTFYRKAIYTLKRISNFNRRLDLSLHSSFHSSTLDEPRHFYFGEKEVYAPSLCVAYHRCTRKYIHLNHHLFLISPSSFLFPPPRREPDTSPRRPSAGDATRRDAGYARMT